MLAGPGENRQSLRATGGWTPTLSGNPLLRLSRCDKLGPGSAAETKEFVTRGRPPPGKQWAPWGVILLNSLLLPHSCGVWSFIYKFKVFSEDPLALTAINLIWEVASGAQTICNLVTKFHLQSPASATLLSGWGQGGSGSVGWPMTVKRFDN